MNAYRFGSWDNIVIYFVFFFPGWISILCYIKPWLLNIPCGIVDVISYNLNFDAYYYNSIKSLTGTAIIYSSNWCLSLLGFVIKVWLWFFGGIGVALIFKLHGWVGRGQGKYDFPLLFPNNNNNNNCYYFCHCFLFGQ